MVGLYTVLRALHNGVGGLTLLLTLAAMVALLATRRTSSGSSALLLRADLISGSVQFVLGLLLLVIGQLAPAGYGARLWVHYLLGIASVGVISALAARARRAPDGEARRYGLLFLAVALLVLFTFTVGQRKLFAA